LLKRITCTKPGEVFLLEQSGFPSEHSTNLICLVGEFSVRRFMLLHEPPQTDWMGEYAGRFWPFFSAA
jgi:hypothetical protein